MGSREYSCSIFFFNECWIRCRFSHSYSFNKTIFSRSIELYRSFFLHRLRMVLVQLRWTSLQLQYSLVVSTTHVPLSPHLQETIRTTVNIFSSTCTICNCLISYILTQNEFSSFKLCQLLPVSQIARCDFSKTQPSNFCPISATSSEYGVQQFGPKFFNGQGPDFVVSGPNVGSNVAWQVLVSGTV